MGLLFVFFRSIFFLIFQQKQVGELERNGYALFFKILVNKKQKKT